MIYFIVGFVVTILVLFGYVYYSFEYNHKIELISQERKLVAKYKMKNYITKEDLLSLGSVVSTFIDSEARIEAVTFIVNNRELLSNDELNQLVKTINK